MKKQIILTIGVLLMTITSLGQVLNICVLEDPGGGYLNSDIEPLAFKADVNGDFYVAYYTRYDLMVSYANYFELTKYDADGNILWNRNLLTDNESSLPYDFSGAYINDIYIDTDNIYLAGNFSSETSIQFLPFELSGGGFNNNEERSFVAALNKTDGELIWLIQDVNFGNKSAATDIVMNNGHIYISFCQSGRQEIYSSNTQDTVQLQGDFLVAKISKEGELLDYIYADLASSGNFYGWRDPDKAGVKLGRMHAFAPKLEINSNGQFVLACFIMNDFTFDTTTVEVRECTFGDLKPNSLIAHINSDLSWHYAHIPFVYLHSMHWDGLETVPRVYLDENRNVTQTFFHTIYETDPPVLSFEEGVYDTIYDGCLMKFTDTGQWIKKDYVGKHLQVKSIAPVDNGFMTFGNFDDQVNIPIAPVKNGYGYSDMFLAGFNNNTEALQIEVFGGLIDDHAYLMDEVDGKVYLLGTTENRIMYNNEYIMNESDAAFVITMDTPNINSVEDQQSGNAHFIYPNPTTGIVTIDSCPSSCDIQILDLQGRAVFNTKLLNNKQFDISHMKVGTYLVQLNSENVYKQQLLIVR